MSVTQFFPASDALFKLDLMSDAASSDKERPFSAALIRNARLVSSVKCLINKLATISHDIDISDIKDIYDIRSVNKNPTFEPGFVDREGKV